MSRKSTLERRRLDCLSAETGMQHQLVIRDALHADVPKIVEFAIALAEESEQIRLEEDVVYRNLGMRETCYEVMEEPPGPKDSPVPV